jgi:hypothetical protein
MILAPDSIIKGSPKLNGSSPVKVKITGPAPPNYAGKIVEGLGFFWAYGKVGKEHQPHCVGYQ